MEKYGVEEEDDGTKLAANGCPDCGAPPEKLRYSGGIVRCPNCGTKPFEPKRRDKLRNYLL